MDKRLDLAARLIEIERAQLGHEIHDALLPLIFAASASLQGLLEAAPPRDQPDGGADSTGLESQRERLEKIADWLQDAQQTGRRLLTQIYPPELETSDWVTVAKDCIERLLGQRHAKVSWQVSADGLELDPVTALAAYRIVVEAIRNADRHGQAQNICVRADSEHDTHAIEIVDDGRGFELDRIPSDRFGIRAMFARAELARGTLDVKSKPGGPTVVTFRVGKQASA